MHGRIPLFILFYGAWGAGQVAIVQDAAANLGGSGWLEMVSRFLDEAGGASADVVLRGTAFVPAVELQLGAVGGTWGVLTRALDARALPLVTGDAIYAVLTSPEVVESIHYCEDYCGFHDVALYNGSALTYFFAGNAVRQCPERCIGGRLDGVTPNGDAGIDGMISVFAHEIGEIITDPNWYGWVDVRGTESSDLCEWDFGDTYTTRNGGSANVRWGARDFLVQQNWLLTGPGGQGYCAMALPQRSASASAPGTPSATGSPSASPSLGAPPSLSAQPSASPTPACPPLGAALTLSAGGPPAASGPLSLKPADAPALPAQGPPMAPCADGAVLAPTLGRSQQLVSLTLPEELPLGGLLTLSVTAVSISAAGETAPVFARLLAGTGCPIAPGGWTCLAGTTSSVFMGGQEGYASR